MVNGDVFDLNGNGDNDLVEEKKRVVPHAGIKKKVPMVMDGFFVKEGKNNIFKGEKAERAINMFINKDVEEGFAEYVDMETLSENDFNLSVTRYVYKEEEREEIDIDSLNDEISELYTQINSTNQKVLDMLKG